MRGMQLTRTRTHTHTPLIQLLVQVFDLGAHGTEPAKKVAEVSDFYQVCICVSVCVCVRARACVCMCVRGLQLLPGAAHAKLAHGCV